MLKKRLIFTLLYADGNFWLSRNFRLQRIGDVDWLLRNLQWARLTDAVDELVVLNVSRSGGMQEEFPRVLSTLANGVFVPVTAGGGVGGPREFDLLLRSGADKVLINSLLADGWGQAQSLARLFGAQSVVAGVDVAERNGSLKIITHHGHTELPGSVSQHLERIGKLELGELFLNSIDRDGVGTGLDLSVMDHVPDPWPTPIVLAGGAGRPEHLEEALSDPRVSAVATAHLLNFLGDGLSQARAALLSAQVPLPVRVESMHDDPRTISQGLGMP